MRVIFLDIDGVLNGWNWKMETIHELLRPIKPLYEKFRLWYIKHGDIHVSKVKRLAKICKQNHAVCVMTSTWRHAYFDKDCDIPDVVRLRKLFKKYHIICNDYIDDSYCGYRARSEGIKDYLDKHPDIIDYIVIDDCMMDGDLKYYQIYTHESRDNKLVYDGLQNKHVKKVKNMFDFMRATRLIGYRNAMLNAKPKVL